MKNSANDATIFKKETNAPNITSTTEIDKNIRSIFQDKNGNYWFGTNAAGVYRYNPSISLRAGEKRITHYTEKDGLSNNQVQNIQEDNLGNIWFGTGSFGVSKFDGQKFSTYTTEEKIKLSHSENDWKTEPNDLWFPAGGGVYRYNKNSLLNLPLGKTASKDSPHTLSPYAVYSILKDKKGSMWFGTQSQGVCFYDGKSFTWFKEKGLAGPAVLAIFEDSKGNMWFGNNGSGLFKYDGRTLINFTEEKGLSNKEFRISGKPGPGTLARIYSINEDNNGNIWIGTVDAGAWKYDGKNLINYTTKDGLTSNAINIIYKDKKGELFFGTDADGVCKFNGISFVKFALQ